MKPFTMSPDTLNATSKPMLPRELGAAHELAHDDAGRLYSFRMRELFENLHVDMSAVEALGALKIAGHMLGLLQSVGPSGTASPRAAWACCSGCTAAATPRWVIWPSTQTTRLATSPDSATTSSATASSSVSPIPRTGARSGRG